MWPARRRGLARCLLRVAGTALAFGPLARRLQARRQPRSQSRRSARTAHSGASGSAARTAGSLAHSASSAAVGPTSTARTPRACPWQPTSGARAASASTDHDGPCTARAAPVAGAAGVVSGSEPTAGSSRAAAARAMRAPERRTRASTLTIDPRVPAALGSLLPSRGRRARQRRIREAYAAERRRDVDPRRVAIPYRRTRSCRPPRASRYSVERRAVPGVAATGQAREPHRVPSWVALERRDGLDSEHAA